jgi:biotin carboxylase
MKKKIMILGAGVYQVPLIKKAKEMGLETIVVSPKGKYPGIPLADILLDIDTTDSYQIVEAAREHNISGITTTGTDVCVPSLGKVVNALGLSGTGYEAARRSMDKVLMKQAFMEYDVPTAAFRMFIESGEAKEFANELGYPVMVKAPDSSGSRGITKVNSAEEFEFAWNRAHEVSRSKEIIVEQFLKGIEFGAQAFVHGDRVVAVFPHGDTVTPAPYFSPIGHSMPTALTQEQQVKTAKVIEQAVRALGIRDCVSNVDLMLVDGEPKMIEIGARMGATCLPENISIYAGQDVYEHLIRLALGEHPEFKVTAKQANACLLLRSGKTGTVTSLDVPPEVLNHPDLIDFHWDVAVGDAVRAFKVGPDRIGHIIVKAATAEEGERLVEQMASRVQIAVAE